MAEPFPMPIRLAAREAAASPTSGRLVFVVDLDGVGAPLVDALGALPDVRRTVRFDLFGRGLHLVFGNYLTARPTGGGLAALCDDQTFLRVTRQFADMFYDADGVTVDASVTNADAPQVIAGVYPDARFFVIESTGPPAEAAALIDAGIVTYVTRAQLGDPDALRGLAAEVVAPEPQPAVTPFKLPELRAPVFVVGCPRSGTTWVQNLLQAHPGLAGPSEETALFVALRGLLENRSLEAAVGRAALLDAVRGYAAALATAYLDRDAPGARFIEKTPIHALHLDMIAELFPDAAIVGVHRDGRDVVRSLLELDRGGIDDAAVAAKRWVEITRLVQDFAAQSPRARDERYEDWLGDPVIGAIDVLTWLGLPPDEAVVDELRVRAPQRVSQYNTTGEVGDGKWREMSNRDLRAVLRVAGDRLVELGYGNADDVAITAPASLTERFRRAMRRR